MRIERTIRPGENGTKKLKALYGFKLVAVRYCVDLKRKKRFTTIELIENIRPIIRRKKKIKRGRAKRLGNKNMAAFKSPEPNRTGA